MDQNKKGSFPYNTVDLEKMNKKKIEIEPSKHPFTSSSYDNYIIEKILKLNKEVALSGIMKMPNAKKNKSNNIIYYDSNINSLSNINEDI